MATNKKSDSQACLRYRRAIERFAENPTGRIGGDLARHVETCPECAEYLDRVAEVHFLLDRLKWRSMPAGTLAACNVTAMKKLETRVRESEKGHELSHAMPDIPRWQKTAIKLSRGGVGIAAGLAVFLMNYSTIKGLDLTRQKLEKLEQVHEERHIGDWNNMDEGSI
jgi:hypothetical protein